MPMRISKSNVMTTSRGGVGMGGGGCGGVQITGKHAYVYGRPLSVLYINRMKFSFLI